MSAIIEISLDDNENESDIYTNEALKYSFMLWKNTGRFIMFWLITNIYNKKTKGPTLMELFTDTGKMKVFFNN